MSLVLLFLPHQSGPTPRPPGAPAKPDTPWDGVSKPTGGFLVVSKVPGTNHSPAKGVSAWGRPTKPDTPFNDVDKPTTSY